MVARPRCAGRVSGTPVKPMKTQRLIIQGRVQGIGYRAFTAGEANALGITGYVRNRERRDEVEVVANGTDEKLARFVDRLREGPPGARISSLTIYPLEPSSTYQEFSIRY